MSQRSEPGAAGPSRRQFIQTSGAALLSAAMAGYLQRGGAPCAYDRRMGRYFGIAAVDLIVKEDFGKMVSFSHGEITAVPLKDILGKLKLVNVKTQYDADRYNGRRSILL